MSALPVLQRLAKNPGKNRGVLGCHGAGHLHAVPEQARELTDLDWSVCPLDLLETPFHKAVDMLDRMAKVAPLAGWPDRYAAWAVVGLMALRKARGE